MQNWRSPNIDLWLVSIMVGVISTLVTQSAWAEAKPNNQVERGHKEQKIDRLSELNQPATTVTDWLTQRETAPVQITGVRIETTDNGLQLLLETIEGELAAPRTETVSNALIVEIPNAVLALPQEETLEEFEPTEGIAFVSVSGLPDNRVQVTITGTDAVPQVQVRTQAGNLVLSVVPSLERVDGADEAINDETIEVVVTGEQETGYYVPNTSVGTRTDTPLRDIPQSIQVVPQQVLEEQQAIRLEDALRNVPGVTQTFSAPGVLSNFTIRGFEVNERTGNSFLRDGLPDPTAGQVVELGNIERVEVLKGPASVLFGFGNPGGTINLVTKQPLREPFYGIDATVGNYSFYRGAIDLSGPLNDPRTILYRLNTTYRNSGSFVDFLNSEYLGISPVVSVAIGEQTNLILDGEYVNTRASYASGVPVQGTILPNPNGEVPRNANFGEPTDEVTQTISRIGYRLEHEFNEQWSLRNAFRATFRYYKDKVTIPTDLDETDNRTFNRFYREYDSDYEDYSLTANVVGRFSTGAIQHQLLLGVDLGRFTIKTPRYIDFDAAPIDIFNPIYGQPLG